MAEVSVTISAKQARILDLLNQQAQIAQNQLQLFLTSCFAAKDYENVQGVRVVPGKEGTASLVGQIDEQKPLVLVDPQDT